MLCLCPRALRIQSRFRPGWQALLAAGALVAGGCTLETPEAPEFESRLSLPLGTRTATGVDLIEGSEYIEGDTTGHGPLRFVMRGTVDRVEVGDALDFELSETDLAFSLDSVHVDPPGPLEVRFPLRRLAARFGGLPREAFAMQVDPFVIEPVQDDVPPPENVDWARLTRGLVRIEIHNALPVPLGEVDGFGQPLALRLTDRRLSRVLLEQEVVGVIEAGGSRSVEIDLSGQELSRDLEVEIEGGSPGSGESEVVVEVDVQSIDIEVELMGLAADSVRAIVPAQRADDAGAVSLPDEVRLEAGELRHGRLTLTVENPFPLPAAGKLTLPNARHRDDPGRAYVAEVNLPPSALGLPGLAEVTLDLADQVLGAESGVLLDSLPYVLAIETAASAGWTDLGTRMAVRARLHRGHLAFASVRGQLDRRVVDIPVTETRVDPPEGLDELRFQGASLALELASTVGFRAEAALLVTGIPDGDGPEIKIPLEFSLEGAEGGAPRVSRVVIDETSSSILDLIAERPRTLRVTGAIALGGDGATGTVRRTDWAEGAFVLAAPLRMRIGRVTHRADPFHFRISEEDQERIREDVVAGEATGIVRNHFPAGLELQLEFARTEEDLGLDPETHPDRILRLDPIEAPPGQVDPGSGRVTGTVESLIGISLDPGQVRFFAHPEIYGQVVLSLEGTDSETTVEVRATDFVEISALLQFRVRVRP